MPQASDTQIKDWWQWFEDNQSQIHAINGTGDPLWDEVVARLQAVHKNLWFEMSGTDDSGAREFVFTAEGNTEAFPIVDSIIASCPDHKRWEFVGLKPPMGFEFSTTYEGIRFDPQTMWFLPLHNESKPESVDLRVGVPDYDTKQKRVTENAVLVILDTAIGERSAAEDLDHVEVDYLPRNPEDDGYIEMPDLPAYISFVKRRNAAKP